MDEIIKAKRYAAGLLSRRMYSESEMTGKLKQKGFGDDTVKAVIVEFIKLKYIDDTEYAKLYFADNININAKGIYRIGMELVQKGISRDIIDEVSAEFENEVYSKLKEYTIMKIQGRFPEEYKEQEKLKAHLLRRGYSLGDIKMVLAEIEEEEAN